MNKYLRFGIPTAVILGTIVYLAAQGVGDTKTYYKNVKEVHEMGAAAQEKRIRVGGDVVANSIVRQGKDVHFKLIWEGSEMNVVYSGTQPLPDTFKDGSQALADGKLGPDGVFQATAIQAKCASKYEAKPAVANPATHSQS
jgi:cytochrome c-type biogenesis protein CcmE